MALGQRQEQKTYLSITHGKVAQGTGAEKQYYTYIDGSIEAIYTKHSHFGGEDVVRWYIDMRDGEELYSLCLPYSSGVFKSIILSLASFYPIDMTDIPEEDASDGAVNNGEAAYKYTDFTDYEMESGKTVLMNLFAEHSGSRRGWTH